MTRASDLLCLRGKGEKESSSCVKKKERTAHLQEQEKKEATGKMLPAGRPSPEKRCSY